MSFRTWHEFLVYFFHWTRIIGFDHRKQSLSQLSSKEESNENLVFHLNLERSSSFSAYEYFSSKLSEIGSDDVSARVILIPYYCFLFHLAVFIQVNDSLLIIPCLDLKLPQEFCIPTLLWISYSPLYIRDMLWDCLVLKMERGWKQFLSTLKMEIFEDGVYQTVKHLILEYVNGVQS